MDNFYWHSLEFRASIKTAIEMWNSHDIRPLVSKFVPPHNHGPIEEWQRIEDRVKENVSRLYVSKEKNIPLPAFAKDNVCEMITVVGSRILAWKDFHFKECNFTALPREFIWTARGTIDKLKTIEVLISDENLDVVQRYVFACTYCLVDHIRRLRRELDDRTFNTGCSFIVSFWFNSSLGRELSYTAPPSPERISYLDRAAHTYLERVFDCDGDRWLGRRFCFRRAEDLWVERRAYFRRAEVLIREIDLYLYDATYIRHRGCPLSFIMICEQLFFDAALKGNEIGVKFFMGKFEFQPKLIECVRSIAERINYSLLKATWSSIEYRADVLCFLFSSLTAEQRTEIYSYCSYEILACFLEWPRQRSFGEIAEELWNLISEKDYYSVLQRISDKIALEIDLFNYIALFKESWNKSPLSHKDYVAKMCNDGILLSKLLKAGNSSNIKLILQHRNAQRLESAAQRHESDALICNIAKDVIEELVKQGHLKVLEFFFRHCQPSKSAVMYFKLQFQPFILSFHDKQQKKKDPTQQEKDPTHQEEDIWDIFYNLLDQWVKESPQKP